MLFNSLNFLVFFAVVYGLYRLLPHRGQNVLLLVSSYAFYAFWDWRFLGLLILSTAVDYVLAQAIHDSDDPRRRRFFLVTSMVVSLAVLGFFKYFNFFVDSARAMLLAIGFDVPMWHLQVILPWGISFYTFQTMNYTIDVYRRHLEPSRNPLEFGVFVSFFPHLVAGPIMRATSLLRQVVQPRAVTWPLIQQGCWLFFWGLFKKTVIADNLAGYADHIFGGSAPLTTASVLLGVYAFAYQIYCDFSGYSDMARGIAKLMGFELMINFRQPYLATNPSDFWRRWHISLSTWLRDYLYIPLGGNRSGPRRTYINLMLTMLLGGLWHGANWTFVMWGGYHGLLLVLHRYFVGDRAAARGWTLWPRRILFFHLIAVSWLLFRCQSFGDVADMTVALFTNPGIDADTWNGFLFLAALIAPLWLVDLLNEKAGDATATLGLSWIPRVLVYALLLGMMLVLGNTGGHAFIYFQF